jgi:hypothetical protein
MQTFAYCSQALAQAVARAAGVEPLTSPPASWRTISPRTLEGHDFIYINLDGAAGSPYWYGDGWETALSAAQIQAADLAGVGVFVASCHLPESPMLPALLVAGAAWVIGGAGVNWSSRRRLAGADLLGLWVRRAVGWGWEPERALRLAKLRVLLQVWDVRIRREDTLRFRVWRRDDMQ